MDESIATGHIRGSFVGVDGGGAPVRFRMLHVFDIRDGLISREQAWFDTAGVIRQVEAHQKRSDGAVKRDAKRVIGPTSS